MKKIEIDVNRLINDKRILSDMNARINKSNERLLELSKTLDACWDARADINYSEVYQKEHARIKQLLMDFDVFLKTMDYATHSYQNCDLLTKNSISAIE